MKDYLRWSLRQLYLIFFWPTRFIREFGGGESARSKQEFLKGLRYLLGLLPWVITLAVLGNLIAGYAFELFGIPFNWKESWVSMVRGVAVAVTSGPSGSLARLTALRAGLDVVYSVSLGIAVGAAFIVVFGVARGVVVSVILGVVYGVLNGLMAGIAESYGLFIESLVMRCVVFGVAFGAAFGAQKGIAKGMGLAVVSGAVLIIPIVVSFQETSVWVAGAIIVMMTFMFLAPSFCVGYFRLVTYPLDLVLSVVTYAAGRWRPHAAARAWRWCPVVWNELIWLPLPLASKLLAMLAKQDKEECFRQIAFVATERKLQHYVVLAALREVALEDLQANSIAEMADATNRINWTMNAPGGRLPIDLATTVPGLDRVARHTEQYLTLNNAYRKGEALEWAVDEIKAVQFQLIADERHFARRLLRIANQWRMLLEEESANRRKLADVTREIPNPFVFGNPVMETEHNLFSGRKDIVRQLEACVLGTRQTPTLLLHGPRRIGKTSILYQLPRLLGPDFAPAVVDCQNPATVESEVTLLRYLSRAFTEGLRLRRVHIQPLTAAALDHEPFSAFDEWLDAVEQQIPERMRVLLCLDEYERLQATLIAGWGGKFLDALRHTLQHRPRVVLMFTGAHTFQELGPEWTDRFISARRVRLSFLRREEVELLLKRPIPAFDMTYAPGALDAIIAATSCQPFLTQAVAFELVQLLNERQRKVATPDDVEEAVARALDSGGEYFANVWSDAGEQGQSILRAVAKGESPPAFHAANTWLRDHDVLNNDGDFAVEMVRRWVKIKSL